MNVLLDHQELVFRAQNSSHQQGMPQTIVLIALFHQYHYLKQWYWHELSPRGVWNQVILETLWVNGQREMQEMLHLKLNRQLKIYSKFNNKSHKRDISKRINNEITIN